MKIMFVCLGNICRSVMAEYIFKSMDKDNKFIVSSSGISSEEEGNDIYYKAKQVLDKNNIKYDIHHAHKITRKEYAEYDYIIVMESYQIDRLYSMFYKKDNVISISNNDIEDPWYTNNFDSVYNQIYNSVLELYKRLSN